jgi:hypothetical protein
LEIFSFLGKGPRVVLIAGQHGNEPAPSIALDRLANKFIKTSPPNMNLMIIPKANLAALLFNKRQILNDMNRSWFSDKKINADLVVDFHEGWGRHAENPKSLGQTIWFSDVELKNKIGHRLLELLNKDSPPNLKWTLLDKIPDVGPGTLDTVCKSYILIETAGQNDIEPLERRIDYVTKAAEFIIAEFNNQSLRTINGSHSP